MQVGALADQGGAIAPDAFDDRLDRLLAELLGDLRLAAAEQFRRVGGRWVGAAARFDDLPQPLERLAQCVGHR